VVPRLSTQGHLAVGVPGTVAGLALAHRRHGKLPWAELVEPARRLAAEGFVVDATLARSLREATAKLSVSAESRRLFQRDGRFYEPGETLRQPELAAVLARVRDDPRDFYEGETARLLAADMKEHGGLVTLEDLRAYEATVREPLRARYRGHDLITMPPPSSGGIARAQMLQMLEAYDVRALGFGSAAHLHLLVEVIRRAFADRAAFLGDTDFVPVPVAGLLDPAYVAARARSIDPARASTSAAVGAGRPAPPEGASTTHFSIVDPEGSVVSNTYTLNDSYGAGVTARGTGILLNNEMDDFTSKPGVPNDYGLVQGEANAIAPRKRPLSSMTPTIVLQDGKPLLVVGSPGGPTIINTVLQVIVNVIDFGMDVQQAVDAPRVHHQWLPDEVNWEALGLSPDTRALLEKRGHAFRAIPGTSDGPSDMGDAQVVRIDPATGLREGASDPRLGGVPVGF
jgi:gamma-glutamyltranspeptidase/glutathione hydrolase